MRKFRVPENNQDPVAASPLHLIELLEDLGGVEHWARSHFWIPSLAMQIYAKMGEALLILPEYEGTRTPAILVGSIWVDEDFRGQGNLRKMLDCWEEWADQEGWVIQFYCLTNEDLMQHLEKRGYLCEAHNKRTRVPRSHNQKG